MRFKLVMRWGLLLSAAANCLALPASGSVYSNALAVRASTDLAKRALQDYFWVKPGGLDQGGCFDPVAPGDSTTYKDKLDKAREEALAMADGAVDALKMLLEDKPKEDDSASKDEFNRAMKWRKAQKSLLDLFDIEVNEREKPDGDAKKKIETMIKNLEAFTETRNAPAPQNLKSKPRMYCGDQGFSWVKPNEESPLPSKKKAGAGGAWYARGMANKDKTKSIPGKLMEVPPGGSTNAFCKPELNRAAITIEAHNIMVFCDKGLKYATTQEEQKGSITDGTELTKVRSTSRTFFHESLHLEAQLEDTPIVTFKEGASAPEYEADGKTVKRGGEDGKKKVYGYLASYNLARFVPSVGDPDESDGEDTAMGEGVYDGPTNTVECYVFFALSMFHDQWAWEGNKGTAVKMPYRT